MRRRTLVLVAAVAALLSAGCEPQVQDHEPTHCVEEDWEFGCIQEESLVGKPSGRSGGGVWVQCEDGSYSPSGGKQGACSGHGGVD